MLVTISFIALGVSVGLCVGLLGLGQLLGKI
jgi:hypothetical protein